MLNYLTLCVLRWRLAWVSNVCGLKLRDGTLNAADLDALSRAHLDLAKFLRHVGR